MTAFFQSQQFTFACAGGIILFCLVWLAIKTYSINHEFDRQKELKEMDKGKEGR